MLSLKTCTDCAMAPTSSRALERRNRSRGVAAGNPRIAAVMALIGWEMLRPSRTNNAPTNSRASPTIIPDLAHLRPKDFVDIVEIDPAAECPAMWFELDRIRHLQKRLAPRGAREAKGYETPAHGADQFKLPAYEETPSESGTSCRFLPSTLGFGLATTTPCMLRA